MICLGFSKTFYTVTHDIIFSKLGNMVLHYYKVATKLAGKWYSKSHYLSEWKHVSSGALQGSVLAPVLSNSFINNCHRAQALLALAPLCSQALNFSAPLCVFPTMS